MPALAIKSQMNLERIIKVLQFSLLSIIILLRQPLFLIHPRIWAEGSIYLYEALSKPWDIAISLPHLGYYSFFDNAVALIASVTVSLPYIPLVTTIISLCIQLWTIAILLYSDNEFLNDDIERFVVALCVIIFCPAEQWLNPINMQFWFALGTLFLITSKRIQISHQIYLILALSAGVTSLFFSPFMILRAARERNKYWIFPSLFSFVMFFIQLRALYQFEKDPHVSRFKMQFIHHIPAAIINTLVDPVFHTYSLYWKILSAILLLLIAIFLAKNWRKKNISEFFHRLIIPATVYSILSIIASVQMRGGFRYSLPIMGVIFIILINASRGLMPKRFYLIPVVIMLLSNVPTYFNTRHVYNPGWPTWYSQSKNICKQGNRTILIYPQWTGARWEMGIPAIYCEKFSNSSQ